LISKSPARSVQLLPRLVLLARLKSSLVGQPDEVLVGVGVRVGVLLGVGVRVGVLVGPTGVLVGVGVRVGVLVGPTG